jgi:N-acetyl-1-D-myo-inositol-2-amino-2-deoxy-alpha-D-glucopyranoside deacetylase
MSTGGLLAVHAHPDDETLATGALLAACAAARLPTTVVTCTRGERGEVIGDALAHLEGDGPALAAHRERELAAALAALGVDDHLFLDTVAGDGARYEDSGMAWVGTGRAGRGDDVPPGAFVAADLEAAAGLLARVIRDRRPAVVVTYEPGGGYGHPDHVRAHEVTMRAVELAAEGGDRPVVLWAAQDADVLRAGYRALVGEVAAAVLGPRLRGGAAAGHRRAPLTLPEADGPLPSVAVEPSRVDADVEVAPVRDAVLRALRAHATQVQAVRAVDGVGPLVGCFALSNLVLAPLPARESYRLAQSSDRAALTALAAQTWPLRVHG